MYNIYTIIDLLCSPIVGRRPPERRIDWFARSGGQRKAFHYQIRVVGMHFGERTTQVDCVRVVVPWHVRKLNARHKHVRLQPSNEQLLVRCTIVAIAADHVRQHQRIADHVQLEQRGDQCGQTVVVRPLRVFVDHAQEYRQILCVLAGPHFDQIAKGGHRLHVSGCDQTGMEYVGAVEYGILWKLCYWTIPSRSYLKNTYLGAPTAFASVEFVAVNTSRQLKRRQTIGVPLNSGCLCEVDVGSFAGSTVPPLCQRRSSVIEHQISITPKNSN